MTSSKDIHSSGDKSEYSWLTKRRNEDKFVRLCGSFGYEYQELPLLAPTDVFLRKSGGELASQMLSLIDATSNLISLRPEFTALIVSEHLKTQPDTSDIRRIQYSGPVFRQTLGASLSEQYFTQVGVELIGARGPISDAELLYLATQIPDQLGITDYTVRITDLRVLNSLLDSKQLSDRARTFIIASVPALQSRTTSVAQLLAQAQDDHIIGQNPSNDHLHIAISGLQDDQAKEVLHGFLEWSEGLAPNLGQRAADDVVDRLLRKLRGNDERDSLQEALLAIEDLVNLKGNAEDIMAAAETLVETCPEGSTALKSLRTVLNLVTDDPNLSSKISVDFGLIKGIAYYDGIVFDITNAASNKILGGGGRYDNLSTDLGSVCEIPSAGFAYNLEALLESVDLQLSADDPLSNEWSLSTLIVMEDATQDLVALRLSRQYREAGHRVVIDSQYHSVAEALSKSSGRTWDKIVFVSASGDAEVHETNTSST